VLPVAPDPHHRVVDDGGHQAATGLAQRTDRERDAGRAFGLGLGHRRLDVGRPGTCCVLPDIHSSDLGVDLVRRSQLPIKAAAPDRAHRTSPWRPPLPIVAASLAVRRLLPDPPAELDRAELAAAYADPRRGRRHGRPWVVTNMIASADGATTVDGRSGGLGGDGDRAIFSTLRALADVVLVGASTVRAEHYGPPRKAGQRVAVVSRSGELDWATELFTSGAGIAVLPEDGPEVPVPTLRAGRGDVDLGTALVQLDAEVVLVEGGPTLNGQLAGAGLIDELCLTVAHRLVGGGAKRIVVGPPAAEPTTITLAHLLEEDGFLFCRYVRDAPGDG
jgi:riboflavin biosynthesis pyrimidine reductase